MDDGFDNFSRAAHSASRQREALCVRELLNNADRPPLRWQSSIHS